MAAAAAEALASESTTLASTLLTPAAYCCELAVRALLPLAAAVAAVGVDAVDTAAALCTGAAALLLPLPVCHTIAL